MLRRLFLSTVSAAALLLMLSFSVMGQTDDTVADPALPRIEPASAVVTQTVPISLTVIVPGPDGTQTITVPIFLNLDLRIDISSELTASVTATATAEVTSAAAVTLPAVITETAAITTPVADATPVASEETATEEPEAEATVEPVAEAPAETEPATEPVTDTAGVVSGLALLAFCPNENVRITSPAIGATVSGVISIEGTADNPNFQYYKVETITGDAAPAYAGGGETPVIDGVLSELDTAELENGDYAILLTVVDNSGNFPDPCTVTITVEN